jgi:hypothetical protein
MTADRKNKLKGSLLYLNLSFAAGASLRCCSCTLDTSSKTNCEGKSQTNSIAIPMGVCMALWTTARHVFLVLTSEIV